MKMGMARLVLLLPLLLLTGCGPTVPDELQGRWIQNLQPLVDQVWVFKSDSVEFNFIDHGSITQKFSDKVTRVFTSARGADIIETDGPPAFAWHVRGTTLYLYWVNSDEIAELESLSSDWWLHDPQPTWTKY